MDPVGSCSSIEEYNSDDENVDELGIMNSFDIEKDYKTVLQRYYKPMYCLSIDNMKIEPHCVLFHSNRICLVTIAPSHPIFSLNKEIANIDFSTPGNIDRLKNKVSGKSKRGGQKLLRNSILCHVICKDGSSYDICSCIHGKLIAVNDRLVENPNLLKTSPNTNGHVAVILSDLSRIEATKKTMLLEEDYMKIYFTERSSFSYPR